MAKPNFRAGVITVVRRSDGRVLAFERADPAGAWQLPQGGIDEGETPEQAAWRELAEETGLGHEQVRLVGEHPHWTIYEWPDEVRAGKARDKVLDRLGQAHRWFFFEPLDGELEPVPDGDEFVAWRWMDPSDLLAEVVEFRRPGYQQVLGRDGDG
jgi:putative (di)nucleoside polyphosphate hydrolase